MARNLFETMNNCACLVRRKILQRYCTIAVCIYFHVGTFITNCSFIVFEYQMVKCGMRQLFSKNVKHKRISFYSAFLINGITVFFSMVFLNFRKTSMHMQALPKSLPLPSFSFYLISLGPTLRSGSYERNWFTSNCTTSQTTVHWFGSIKY